MCERKDILTQILEVRYLMRDIIEKMGEKISKEKLAKHIQQAGKMLWIYEELGLKQRRQCC
jgi:hypothetical protein